MPLKTDGDKVVISLILTREQDRRLRERQRRMQGANPMRPVTLAEVGREVVEAGLHVLSFAPVSSFVASCSDVTEGVA